MTDAETMLQQQARITALEEALERIKLELQTIVPEHADLGNTPWYSEWDICTIVEEALQSHSTPINGIWRLASSLAVYQKTRRTLEEVYVGLKTMPQDWKAVVAAYEALTPQERDALEGGGE